MSLAEVEALEHRRHDRRLRRRADRHAVDVVLRHDRLVAVNSLKSALRRKLGHEDLSRNGQERPLDAPVPNQTAPRQIVNQLPPQTRAFFHGHGRKGYGPLLGHCLAALLQVIASHGTTAAVTSAAESASVRFKEREPRRPVKRHGEQVAVSPYPPSNCRAERAASAPPQHRPRRWRPCHVHGGVDGGEHALEVDRAREGEGPGSGLRGPGAYEAVVEVSFHLRSPRRVIRSPRSQHGPQKLEPSWSHALSCHRWPAGSRPAGSVDRQGSPRRVEPAGARWSSPCSLLARGRDQYAVDDVDHAVRRRHICLRDLRRVHEDVHPRHPDAHALSAQRLRC